jgi:hypothetical protein
VSWRGDLVSRLRADATLASLLGTRIAWFEAGRSWTAFPQLVMQEISPGREYTHNGPDGLDGPRVQFDIYAATGTSAEAVEAALLACMEAGGTRGDTTFHPAFLEDRGMSAEDLADGQRALRLRMDFIFYHETV